MLTSSYRRTHLTGSSCVDLLAYASLDGDAPEKSDRIRSESDSGAHLDASTARTAYVATVG